MTGDPQEVVDSCMTRWFQIEAQEQVASMSLDKNGKLIAAESLQQQEALDILGGLSWFMANEDAGPALTKAGRVIAIDKTVSKFRSSKACSLFAQGTTHTKRLSGEPSAALEKSKPISFPPGLVAQGNPLERQDPMEEGNGGRDPTPASAAQDPPQPRRAILAQPWSTTTLPTPPRAGRGSSSPSARHLHPSTHAQPTLHHPPTAPRPTSTHPTRPPKQTLQTTPGNFITGNLSSLRHARQPHPTRPRRRNHPTPEECATPFGDPLTPKSTTHI